MSGRRSKERRRVVDNVFINADDFTEILRGDDFGLQCAFESGSLIMMERRDYERIKKEIESDI